jgi:hypothetical protein
MKLKARELATILAALRAWQGWITKEHELNANGLMDIATDGDTLDPMSWSEVDDLCGKLNSGLFID